MKNKYILFITAIMLVSLTVGCTVPVINYDVDIPDIPFITKSGCSYCSSLEGITLPRYTGDDLWGDIDNDGVMNVYDCCWTVPTNWLGVVFGTGCVDSDFDTIADPWDECPNVAGVSGSFESPLGCPRTDTPTTTTPTTTTTTTTTNASATNAPPVADFSYTLVGSTIYLNGSLSTDDVNVTTYLWNYGDGTVGTGATSTHTYSGDGTMYVILTVVDGGGLTGMNIKEIDIDLGASTGSTSGASGGQSKWFGFLVIIVIIGAYIFIKLGGNKNTFVKIGKKRKVGVPSMGGGREPVVVHTYTRKSPEHKRGLI